jgi:hypothetical protein
MARLRREAPVPKPPPAKNGPAPPCRCDHICSAARKIACSSSRLLLLASSWCLLPLDTGMQPCTPVLVLADVRSSRFSGGVCPLIGPHPYPSPAGRGKCGPHPCPSPAGRGGRSRLPQTLRNPCLHGCAGEARLARIAKGVFDSQFQGHKTPSKFYSRNFIILNTRPLLSSLNWLFGSHSEPAIRNGKGGVWS